jgi:hypothetical protein
LVTNPGKPAVDRSHRDAVAVGLERLCEWAVAARSAPLPDAVRRRAALVVSDDIAAMVVAASEPQVSAAQERILSSGGKAEATVFGSSRTKAPRSLAAAANGLAVPWAELDEGYRPLPCHAGGYTLPALLAEAEAEKASVQDVLRALCISYEITTRIAHTFPFDSLTIHPHGAFNAIGAAAGIAVLRGYDAAMLCDTLKSAATPSRVRLPGTPGQDSVRSPAFRLLTSRHWESLGCGVRFMTSTQQASGAASSHRRWIPASGKANGRLRGATTRSTRAANTCIPRCRRAWN